jgi:DNA-binding transcriptional LysR family regulator
MVKSAKQAHYKQNRLQQLRGFCHVVQTGSISKAAERMFLSQPSVSLQIQALERELKVMLFERNGPHLKLTPQGATLYDLARPLVDGMDNLYDNFSKRYSDTDTGSISIAAGPSVINYVIKEPIKHYAHTFSNVNLKVNSMGWEEAVNALKADEIDLAITGLPDAQPHIFYEPLLSFDTVLILPLNHPLREVDEPTLEQISEYPFVMPLDHGRIEYVFKRHNLQYDVRVEVGGLDLVKRFVESGIGISIVSSVCIEEGDNVLTRDLSHYFPYREYGILSRKGRVLSPQVKNFIQMLKSDDLIKGHQNGISLSDALVARRCVLECEAQR